VLAQVLDSICHPELLSFPIQDTMGCSQTMSAAANEEVLGEDFLDRYILGMKLGRGAFATVRVCSKVSAGPVKAWDDKQKAKHERAVKIIDMRDKEELVISESLQKAAHIEAYCWKTVGMHPNCVQLHDLFHGDDFCYMVMEKCQSGLLQALESMPELTERGLGNVAAQMLLGVAHCHSVKVVHRDIKPDNFLVGGEDGVIKLADFGLSAIMPKTGKLPGVFGTAPFMCPEMIRDRSYNEKADVWSLGVVAYVMMYGQFPYTPEKPNAKAMKEVIVLGLPAPAYTPTPKAGKGQTDSFRTPEAVEVIEKLLDRDPEKRPSAEETLHLPWISACMQGCHVSDSELPSLRPMLHAAKKCGAFEVRDLAKETMQDCRLEMLQVARNGTKFPETPSSKRKSAADDSPCSPKSFSTFEVRKTPSGLWGNSSNRSTSCDSEAISGVPTSSSDCSLDFPPSSPCTPRTPHSSF